MSLTNDIKADFGKRLREARDSKKYSRQVLGVRLGVSPKTIQSWEMGRTFIENLSLIPAIERELDISISKLIKDATYTNDSMINESAAEYGKSESPQRGMPVAGPLAVSFTILSDKKTDVTEASYKAVPFVKPKTLGKDVADIKKKDVLNHVLIPVDWIPRGSVDFATRMADASLEPYIPHGAQVIVDRREPEAEKCLGKAVVLFIKNKGVRIRMLSIDEKTGLFCGTAYGINRRGKILINPEKGDIIIGKVVSVMSQC